ncbi:MAG: hypothetical protein KAH38_04365 [Candidatus Hydrogenedentes bacterium]|nr:hypothetical protein [Candidatus Hydrogenedentota bacterium]
MNCRMSLLYFGILITSLVCTGCATFRPGAPAGQVDVIAHRGASAKAPENTMAAFRLADEMGADWFELDCYLTRDHGVIVIHDNTLERTVGIKKNVADYDLEALQKMDAGSWKNARFAEETLPTLAETLDFAKNKIGVYVEIKNVADDTALLAALLEKAVDDSVMTPFLAGQFMDAIEASGTRNLPLTRNTIALIRARNMERNVVIQSFSPIVCAIARIEAPDIRVELLSGLEPEQHDVWERICRWVFLLDVQGLNLNAKGITPGRLAVIQSAGKTVAAYTVDDTAAMNQLAVWGVDSIITNCPDRCLRTLGRK